MKKPRQSHRIHGHDIARPRLTAAGLAWCFVYLALPVLLVGSVLDALAQWLLGWCVGLWCMV